MKEEGISAPLLLHLCPQSFLSSSLLPFGKTSATCWCHIQPVFWFPPSIQWPDEIMIQEMETVLRSLWSEQLLWVKYAHNTLISSATCLFLFQCTCEFQRPLLTIQEKEASCPCTETFHLSCHPWISMGYHLSTSWFSSAFGHEASPSSRAPRETFHLCGCCAAIGSCLCLLLILCKSEKPPGDFTFTSVSATCITMLSIKRV